MLSGAALTAFLMKRMLSCGYEGRALTRMGMRPTRRVAVYVHETSPVVQLVRSDGKPDLGDGMHLGGHGVGRASRNASH